MARRRCLRSSDIESEELHKELSAAAKSKFEIHLRQIFLCIYIFVAFIVSHVLLKINYLDNQHCKTKWKIKSGYEQSGISTWTGA